MNFILIVLVINFIKLSSGDLCEICLCSGEDIDCNGRVGNQINNLKLLTSEIAQEIIISHDNSSIGISVHKNKIQQFKTIDLSNNNLNDSAINGFSSLINLEQINLSWNNWKDISEVFKYYSSLSKLDLSHNLITEITIINSCNLTHLDLSYNHLVTLSGLNCPHLKFINLSFNSITSIDAQAFANFNSIDTLMLNNNLIQSLDVFLPSIKNFSVAHNKLFQFPANLSVEFIEHLQFLDVSNNNLNFIKFINANFINLKSLNISYNNFSSIPSLSYEDFPALEEFIVSGNPINKLIFNEEIKLKRFIASDLNLLESIDENSFNLLQERDNCINLTISGNKNLKFLHENSFKNHQICYLDLSNNGLERVTKHSIKSNELIPKYGINLQGNPMICDCESQWMLDDLLPKLYTINSGLLTNLRCNKPTEVFNIRMVHWYKWKTKVLCKSSNKFERFVTLDDNTYAVAQSSSMIIIKSSNSAKFIIIGAATVLSLITMVGLVLSEKLARKHRRRNRRL